MKKISLVVATKNESEKLKSCLASVSDFADEIVIFCLGDRDRALDNLSRKYKAKIINKKPVKYIELLRNEMLNAAGCDWILILDPDEEVSHDLKNKLRTIAAGKGYVAVNIPTKNIIFGKWVKHTNWWPDKHLRFVKKGNVVWTKNIHLGPKVSGKIYDLPSEERYALIHHSYKNLSEFFEKGNRYSDVEADLLYEHGTRASFCNLILWPTREFLFRYIKYKGFLDGVYGFVLSYSTFVYKMMVWVKLRVKEKSY
jgi:(heptosyl)LPS beta-1,4-glucosyltransferase